MLKAFIVLVFIISLIFSAPVYTKLGDFGAFILQVGNDASDLDNIYFKLTGNNSGWVAFGVGTSMANYDVTYFNVQGSSVTCEDQISTGFSAPTKDSGTQSCTMVTGSFSSNNYNVEWKRPFAKQTNQEDQDIVCGNNKFVIAYHNSETTVQNKHSDRYSLTYNILETTFPRCVGNTGGTQTNNGGTQTNNGGTQTTNGGTQTTNEDTQTTNNNEGQTTNQNNKQLLDDQSNIEIKLTMSMVILIVLQFLLY